jgi:hypothetical protein
MITAQQLSAKFELLDPVQRQTVAEFIDVLLRNHPAQTADTKAALLHTSVWSDESIHQSVYRHDEA